MLRLCPDDGEALLTKTIHGIEVDICLRCGGLWLDRGEIARIRAVQPDHIKDFVGAAPDGHPTRASSPPCPICKKTLQPFNYCGGKAHLETCPDLHGLWVPEAELEKLAEQASPEARARAAELSIVSEEHAMHHKRAQGALSLLTQYMRGGSFFWHF